MISETQLTKGQRLAAVMDHLGIETAHFAAGSLPLDVFDLMRERPESVSSLLMLSIPLELDVELLEPVASRTVYMVGELSIPAQQVNLKAMQGWSGLNLVEYPKGYMITGFSDLVEENAGLVLETISRHAQEWETPSVELTPREDEVEGIALRVAGTGPPLILFPIGLAPSQWNPVMKELEKHFTTVRLGGEQLGMASLLEGRATSGTYIQGVRSMFDLLQIKPGDRVLEVGTGPGPLARDLATRVQGLTEVVGVDINDYLLDEARNFARKAALVSPLRFDSGNAENLPFENETFDVAFSATVFEECDADKAISELGRVIRPGGRAGVIVRSRDLPWYWNLDASEQLKAKLNVPDPSAPVAPGGCVDSSLYAQFAERFSEVKPNVFWYTTSEPLPLFVGSVKARLDDAENREFDEALASGKAAGTFFAAMPHHCVVGTKAS